MSKPVITYQQLRTVVYNYITSYCKNVGDNYNSIHVSFTEGFTNDNTTNPIVSYGQDGRAGYGAWHWYKIIAGTGIAQVTAAHVGEKLDNFIRNQMGVSNQAEVVPANDLLNAISNLTGFCIANIYFAKSPWYTNGILYFKYTSDTQYNSLYKKRVTPISESDLISATNTTQLIEKVTYSLKNSGYRDGNCRYTVAFNNAAQKVDY